MFRETGDKLDESSHHLLPCVFATRHPLQDPVVSIVGEIVDYPEICVVAPAEFVEDLTLKGPESTIGEVHIIQPQHS